MFCYSEASLAPPIIHGTTAIDFSSLDLENLVLAKLGWEMLVK